MAGTAQKRRSVCGPALDRSSRPARPAQTAYATSTVPARPARANPARARLVTHSVHNPAREAFRVESPGNAGRRGGAEGTAGQCGSRTRCCAGRAVPALGRSSASLGRTRVSRCFYARSTATHSATNWRRRGLLPKEYHNRLSPRLNGLWLTITSSTVPSRIIPNTDQPAPLRSAPVVAKCRRTPSESILLHRAPAFTWPYPKCECRRPSRLNGRRLVLRQRAKAATPDRGTRSFCEVRTLAADASRG
jgi:hypothetical protein